MRLKGRMIVFSRSKRIHSLDAPLSFQIRFAYDHISSSPVLDFRRTSRANYKCEVCLLKSTSISSLLKIFEPRDLIHALPWPRICDLEVL